jgi:hypothetical protein
MNINFNLKIVPGLKSAVLSLTIHSFRDHSKDISLAWDDY